LGRLEAILKGQCRQLLSGWQLVDGLRGGVGCVVDGGVAVGPQIRARFVLAETERAEGDGRAL